MLRKGIALAALSVASLAAFAPSTACAQASAQATPWELTLGGAASNGPDFNGFNASMAASLGYYLNDNLEVAVRQSLTYSDIGAVGASGGGSALNASTSVALDLHFPLGDRSQFVPYIGANVGFVYGDSVNDTFQAGPEGGLKVYVNERTFVFLSVQYQFFFDQDDDAGDAFSDGQFIYGLGVGFRF
jgi:outer membrane protein W